MAYQTITATNLELQCGIQIQCTSTGVAVGNIDSVVIKRRYTGTSSWTTISTIPIATISDFSFLQVDVDVRSGYSYDYAAIPRINGAEQPGVFASCTCKFGGIYIGDSTGAWIGLFNCEYSKQRNTQVAYITTLAGKYPRQVSNAETNYESGSVTGLFLPYDKCGYPYKDKAREYKDSLLDMLTNKKPKLLKTYDGNAWIVSVDANPKENFSPFIGAETTTFNWTEIAALDKPPRTLDNNDELTFWINEGCVFMDGMKTDSTVDFIINADGTVSFTTVEQEATMLSINDGAYLYQYRPSDTAPLFTLNSNGILAVTI